MKKIIVLFVIRKKSKNPEISYIFKKTLIFYFICGRCGSENGKIFKEKESIEILKVLCLIKNI